MSTQQLFRSIYYMVIIGMLLFCAYYTILSLLVDDQLRFFAFTVDTAYLHWNVSFPAVTICEMFNGGKAWELSEKYYGTDRNNKLDDFLSDVAFFNGKCHSCNQCKKGFDCPTDLIEITSKFRSSCDEMISDCAWNNKHIECCDAFLPLETEMGICYTINSIHTMPMYGNRLISNRYTGPGILSFVAHEDVQVHVHAGNEVPYDIESDIKEDIFYGSEKEIIIKVIDMVNDASVQEASIFSRKCRFAWERHGNDNDDKTVHSMLYNQYSHSTCGIECSMDIQLELCNCSHHLMPYSSDGNTKTCDIDGLICLTNNFGKIDSMKRNCSCVASCDEPEYNLLYSSPKENYRNEPGSSITIAMLDLPKERFIRRVVKTIMDDVISIASVISLLFGVSILSTLDYILRTVKYLFTIIVSLFPATTNTKNATKHQIINTNK